MLSETGSSHSTANAPPQYGHNVAQDRTRLMPLRTCAHRGGCECELGRGARSDHLTNLSSLQLDRCGSDACRQSPSTFKETVHVQMTSQVARRSAVHRMPPELLGIIFENCLDALSPCSVVLSEPPLVFGRVCSYWRSVSHHTPRLWTSFSLRFLETNVDRSHDGVRVATAIETWLHRSYPSPLSIAFTDHRIYQKNSEDVVIWLLSRIRMHAPRWKAIHIKLSSDYFTQLAMLSACTFTSLTSFSVHIDHMGWRSSLLSLRLDLAQATRLTSLEYTGPEHVLREDILVDWEQLTSVAFSYDLHESGGGSGTLSRHFSTLALCRNLAELSIGLSTTAAQHLHPLDAMTDGHTVIELPRLHTLRVRRLSRAAHACALIDVLRLPQLSTLYIDSAILVGWNGSHMQGWRPDLYAPPVHMQVQAQTHWWHAHHFSALLDRSACRLRTLHIRNVDISPMELTRLLMSLSTSATLSTFTFEPFPRAYPISDVLVHLVPAPNSTSPSPSPTINTVSIPNSPSPLFPSLAKLRLGCTYETHLDALADIIESRTGDRAAQAGVRPLAVFELVFYDFLYCLGPGGQPLCKASFDAFRQRVLRCARDGGVDVDIRVERPYQPVYLSVS